MVFVQKKRNRLKIMRTVRTCIRPGTLVRTVRMFGGPFQFLCKYLYNGFDAPEPPDPAALVVPDVVVMFQVVFLLMLGKVRTEAFRCHRFGGVVITP